MTKHTPAGPRGRAATANPDSRHAAWTRERADDGWPQDDAAESVATELMVDRAQTIVSRNDSPDIPFDRSVNPYRGCEHGCIYCYARPSHAWLGLSPGLDFETRLAWKPDAAELLRAELARPAYARAGIAPIALGVNTDAWQPVERRLGITRRLLGVLLEFRHPVTIVTKSALILRDLDLLAPLAHERLVAVAISLTTGDAALARTLEPRAAAPHRRLEVIAALAQAGIPVGVMCAPLIPALTDHELESLLSSASEAGARFAAYTPLRLPLEVAPLFRAWLEARQPGRAAHVMSLVQQLRGGRDNDPRFTSRMRGEGPLADLYQQRFRLAVRRLGYGPWPELATNRFRVPEKPAPQMALF